MKQISFLLTVVCIFASLFLALSIGSAREESLTFDEIVHIEEGLNAWKNHSFDIDTNNPPLIRELAVIPLLIHPSFYLQKIPNQSMFAPRMIIIALSMILGICLFLITNRFFGLTTAVFSIALFSIDPNILAYNHYVTQDIGAALAFFLGYTSLLFMLRAPSWKTFVWHGVCMGLLSATKITLFPYYALSAFMVVPYILRNKIFAFVSQNALKIVSSILLCAVIIWGTYFFKWNVVVVPTSREGRVSDAIFAYGKSHKNPLILQGLHFLQYQKIPLGDYFAVLKNTAIRSTRSTPTFFMGKEYPSPKWYFMVINVLVKTPLSLLILFLLGLWSGLSYRVTRTQTLLMLFPIISILGASMISPMQPLIRYILPIYPFIFVIAGLSLPSSWTYQKFAVFLLFAWSIVTTFNQYPHFISYANEFVRPRTSRYTLLSDSNLDWGQGLISLFDYIESVKPHRLSFSYFGRDNASVYGFESILPYGSHKANNICAFHDVEYQQFSGPVMTVISVSNWYACGYVRDPKYAQTKISEIIGDSFLVFNK